MKSLLMGTFLAALIPASNLSAAQEEKQPPEPVASVAAKKAQDSDFTLGLAYHGPSRLTASATFMWGEPRMLVAWAPAKLAQVRVGARGAQLGLGLVAGVFEESAWRPSGLAVTIKAIGIRTWRDPTGATNGHSYAGIESDVILLGIRGSIGYARKVAGGGEPDGRLVWSIGLGL